MENLLKDGVSQTWLVGHNLVTITTSGCPSGPTRSGLCERCAQLGKAPSISLNSKSLSDAGQSPLSPEQDQRYTKMSLQHSSGNESAGSTDHTSSSSTSNSAANTHPHRQISNSSTASLDTCSRRGSNPEASAASNLVEVSNTGSNTSLLGNSMSLSTASVSPSTHSVVQQPVCVRACTGWAEVYIRRPTGNISWITRIQNPIANDCFGHDLPFNSVLSLFLPTAYGGVFGPDSTLLAKQPRQAQQQETQSEPQADPPAEPVAEVTTAPQTVADISKRMVAKTRALQRQEEIHSINNGASGTAAIDIPIPRMVTKRGKDAALSGSVSDGEADDDILAFGDAQGRARNPVRRVNSSPEMRSSWRQTFLAAKPAPLSQNPEAIQSSFEEPQLPSKKKSVQYSTKDMRVSCEAIPEEIAGSTPPQTAQGLKFPLQPIAGSLPPKQHSADDVSSQVASSSVQPALVQTSASASSLKQAAIGKPPLSPGQAQQAAASAVKPTIAPVVNKATPYGAASLGLTKSNSGGNNNNASVGIGIGSDYNNGSGEMMRGRSKTISVVREVNNGKARPPPASSFRSFGPAKPPISAKLCINPSFMFLQLYSTGQLEVTETPLKVGPENSTALGLLDLVPPFETHKIGVLYVGRNQCNNEVEILRNSYGSTRYVEFLRCIGTLVSLKEAEQNNLFIGLDKNGSDGKFAYIWKDDILQVNPIVIYLKEINDHI